MSQRALRELSAIRWMCDIPIKTKVARLLNISNRILCKNHMRFGNWGLYGWRCNGSACNAFWFDIVNNILKPYYQGRSIDWLVEAHTMHYTDFTRHVEIMHNRIIRYAYQLSDRRKLKCCPDMLIGKASRFCLSGVAALFWLWRIHASIYGQLIYHICCLLSVRLVHLNMVFIAEQ